MPGRNDLVFHADCHIDWDGERKSLIASTAAVDMRIDADHPPARIEQRPSGVPGIDSHVGLDEGYETVIRQAPPLGADDPHAHPVLEPEGRPDGEHPFSNFEIASTSKCQGG